MLVPNVNSDISEKLTIGKSTTVKNMGKINVFHVFME
jgi:hypothetical protein